MTNRLLVASRLIDLSHSAQSVICDRLNASPNQPQAYPLCVAAANLVDQIVDAAIAKLQYQTIQ